ncbi:hypothetical protein [Saccharicrinis aurantiacus]|uniref:hypothetical protein n=1 Tax=Saccharicrinis aurantiacus TaxID=1849719 RepID=UPI002490BBC7|nr:hypothetical protein [Saccharicrinis aurantiacus]
MNKKNISFDGINLYITLESEVKKWVRIVLVSANIAIYSLIIYGMLSIPEDEINTFILPIFGFSAIIFFTLTWTTVWNIFGKEQLTINHKSFNSQKSYGFFQTNIKTIKTEYGISLSFEDEFSYDEKQLGAIHFYKYTEIYLSEFIYKTTIKTDIKTFEEINSVLENIYNKVDTVELTKEINLN